MITMFEKITEDLTEQERKEIAPKIIKGFNLHNSKDKIISNKEVRRLLNEKYGFDITDAKFRKFVQYIRLNDLCDGFLINNSRGYYTSKDENEVSEWFKSFVQRRNSLTQTINAVLQAAIQRKIQLNY